MFPDGLRGGRAVGDTSWWMFENGHGKGQSSRNGEPGTFMFFWFQGLRELVCQNTNNLGVVHYPG